MPTSGIISHVPAADALDGGAATGAAETTVLGAAALGCCFLVAAISASRASIDAFLKLFGSRLDFSNIQAEIMHKHNTRASITASQKVINTLNVGV